MLEINKVYNMDCLEGLKILPNESVNLILTDPPYEVNYQNNYTLKKHDKIIGDTNVDYLTFGKECYRVLKNNSHAYFFTRYDVYPEHYDQLIKSGFKIKNVLVIEKGQIGGVGDLKGSFANNCEWIIFCQKGRREFNTVQLLKNKKPVGKKLLDTIILQKYGKQDSLLVGLAKIILRVHIIQVGKRKITYIIQL